MYRILLSASLCLSLVALHSQDKFMDQAVHSMPDFIEFLSIPNDANYIEDIVKNVSWVDHKLKERNFTTTIWDTPTRPVLFAEAKSKMSNKPTVLFYFHADGQSVDPQFWFQGDPFVPVLKKQVEGEGWVNITWDHIKDNIDPEWRIFARSSSDSKCNIIMFLEGLDMIDQEGIGLPYNLKVLIDFEEEKSSPSLPEVVEDHKDELSADMLVIYDGPRHISNRPTIAFGARGIAAVTLTTYGPVFAQHSGHYGNYAPNPALRMSQLLASMKDDDGRVLIDGYYDGISFDKKTEQILDAVPDNEAIINAKLGISQPDSVADSYQKALQYPSLNIRGMASGWVGSEARTIVPSQATAEIDIRLVKESNPNKLIQLLKAHIVDQGYHIIYDKPTQRERLSYKKLCRFNSKISYQAFRTEFDSEVGVWLNKALTRAFGSAPIRERTMGGSIPISPFVRILEAPAVVIPFANKDNNQHSPNENLRLGNYIDGIKTMYYILSTPIN